MSLYDDPSALPQPAPAPQPVNPTDQRDMDALRAQFAASLAPRTPAALDRSAPKEETKSERREVKNVREDDKRDFVKALFSNPTSGANAPALSAPLHNPDVFAKPAQDATGINGMFAPRSAPAAPDPNRPGQFAAIGPWSAPSSASPAAAPVPSAPPPTPAAGPSRVDPASLVTAAKPGSPASSGNGFAMPGQGGGAQTIAAHNVAAVDPAFQAQERELAGREGEHVLQQGEQNAQAGLAKGHALGELVSADKAQGMDQIAAQQDAQAKLQPLIDESADTMRQRAALHMTNPDKRGTFGRIADAIGAGLSAAGMGLLHQSGPNPVLERIHGDIDREVDRQKDEFTRKGTQLQDQDNLYAKVYKLTGDAKQARAAVQQAMVSAAKDHVDQVATTSAAPGARQSAQILKDKIDETDLARKIQENPRVQAQTVGGPAADYRESLELQKAFNLTPAQANARIQNTKTGRDMGELAPLVKPAPGGAAAFSPSAVPSLAGKSTAWDLSRLLPGTDAEGKVVDQQAYNAQVDAYIKNVSALRGEPAERALKAYGVGAGMTQAQISEHRKAFLAAIKLHDRPISKGGSAEPGDETP